jgi:hypothetical protein
MSDVREAGINGACRNHGQFARGPAARPSGAGKLDWQQNTT